MKIKYSYCLNEDGDLVHISSVTPESKTRHTYRCLGCGQELTPRMGKIKVHHFAHATNTACDGESYLHKLAKRRIREKFQSSPIFPITFVRSVPCSDSCKCLCHEGKSCFTPGVTIASDLKEWQGKIIYDTCQEEVRIGDFQPDLLLSCSKAPERPPVFIEVYKTHRSDERKLQSGHRIIETKQLRSESDIDSIIERGFVEGENCQMYDFSPILPPIRKNDVPITRFALFGNHAAKVWPAIDYFVYCNYSNKRYHPQSVRELNIKGAGMDIWGMNESGKLDTYQTGLVYLTKKGLDIRNCILCKYYRYNSSWSEHVCIRYKELGEEFHFPKQTSAHRCCLYEKSPVLLNHELAELEKEVTEVPL